MRLSLKNINVELAKRGANTILAKGDGYFYFTGGDVADWLDRTIRVPTLQSLSLEQWVAEFQRLSEQNRKLLQSVEKPSEKPVPPAPGARPKTKRSKR